MTGKNQSWHGIIFTRYHYTESKNWLKDDIEFVTEFPCLLGHPVVIRQKQIKKQNKADL